VAPGNYLRSQSTLFQDPNGDGIGALDGILDVSIILPRWVDAVGQRGNRREAIFFEDGDQQIYCDMLSMQLRKFNVDVWAYCLMPNHVHLILTPQGPDGMSRALGKAHRRYTNFVNARAWWTGDLFQRRFGSVA
jgi:putative transposase